MKKIIQKSIYIYAALGLILVSQPNIVVAQVCNDESNWYSDEEEGSYAQDCDSIQSKSWFNSTKSHRRGPRGLETISLANSSFTVSGVTKSIEIKKESCFFCSEERAQTVYISKLIISAQGGSNSDATMQVVVNGDVKGTIHVPRTDPAYFVTIGEVTSSIEFIPVSGSVEVLDIKLIGSKNIPHNYIRGHYRDRSYIDSTRGGHGSHNSAHYYDGYYNQAQDMALRSVDIVNELMDYSSYSALGKYLLPIKKSAAQVYAIASGSQYSKRMLQALKNLADQLGIARPYIARVLESQALFDLAMELMSFEEELRSITGDYSNGPKYYGTEKQRLKGYFKSIKK